MKPLEFKIEEKDNCYVIVFFYENGKTYTDCLSNIPNGLELNKHYFIGDLYGSPVVDDRKGL